jgi:hypothetical protein
MLVNFKPNFYKYLYYQIIFTCFFFVNFLCRMAPEVLQPGTGYNFKYVGCVYICNLFARKTCQDLSYKLK